MSKPAAQYTPGEWKVEEVGTTGPRDDEPVFEITNGGRIATVVGCQRASLMAAAPELLEACKELREAAAACFRVIAAHGLSKELDKEFNESGVACGFGSRADHTIQKATGGGQ